MRPQSTNSGLFDPTQSIKYSFIVSCCAALVLLIGTANSHAEEDLSGLIQNARTNFKPVDEKQVAEARAELLKRLDDVHNFVEPSTENGKHWLHYLRYDALKQAVSEERPKDLAPLQNTLSQLNRNETSLEKSRFRRLAIALRRYRDLVGVSSWEKQDESYGKQLDALQRELDAYRKEPSPQTQVRLSERIGMIEGIGQAPKLVAALRNDFAKPNAFANISIDLVAASAGPIDRCEPVTDCILGTDIHSNAHTTGHVHVVTIPSDTKAIVEFHSHGLVYSDNTGFNGPAVIRSTSDTNFTATKRVELSDEAFVSTSASADADTDIHLHSVSKQGGGLGSRLISSIGMSKAQSSRGQAESIAADHAETRISNRFNEELDSVVSNARSRYIEEYRRPLERRGEVPSHIRFSSTKNSVGFEATQAGPSQLGASSAPPEVTEKHDVTLRLHETAIDNYSASLVGGATARQTKEDEEVKFNVPMPKWMDNMWKNRKTESTNAGGKDEPFKQYALTLRDNRPISVGFTDNKVKLTVHIAHLKSGDKDFENWDVTGTYTPELTDGKVILRRDGDLVMLPADFRGQLNARQVGERRNLEQELNRRSDQGHGFPKAIQFDPIKPEGKVADAGPLEFNQFVSKDGWIVIGLDRQSKSKSKEKFAKAKPDQSNLVAQ